ncbi:MAG: Aminopeptidase YwaD precursor [Candidatus Heimdallarchaeota archaeon LC_2]|nr:MAG: Aminopeptidase YwaD precursor [Candidatus Heimdallarchaeota archaeon LC_2]
MSINSFFLILLLILNTSITSSNASVRIESPIDPVKIRQLMQDQIDMGPRVPGTQASLDFQTWLIEIIDTTVWEINTHSFDYNGIELRNYWIVGAGASDYPNYIIGAHYDSRAVADKEPSTSPVPGANDGASGVAGILELIRHIPTNMVSNFGFVLFDGEDQGSNGIKDANNISWPWIVGSNYFVSQMTANQIDQTRAFVLYDMIADDDFRLPYEPNSNSTLISQFWGQAESLGYGDIFVDQRGTGLIDDHIPFKNAGIPSIDIIDFTYPEYHTTLDDMDHISETSVAIVVDVTLEWIINVVALEIIDECYPSSACSVNTSTNNDTTSANTNFPSIFSLLLFPLIIMIRSYIKRKN